MKKVNYYASMLLAGSMFYFGCEQAGDTVSTTDEVPQDVLTKLVDLGFDIDDQAPIVTDGGYIVEGDIFLTDAAIAQMKEGRTLPVEEQYSTDNLVSTNGNRVITIYAPEESSGGGKGKKPKSGYSPAMIAGLDLAIARYNSENLEISFQRVTSSGGADIVMTRLNKNQERQGILGSAGFPTSNGDPYGEIKMSGVLESSYGLSTAGIATIIAHEMGHCVGMRHTDYFDRSVSCGGGLSNEGDGGVGANHIPGTPTGATANAKSWMLACTDGGDRPFNNDDKTALDYLY